MSSKGGSNVPKFASFKKKAEPSATSSEDDKHESNRREDRHVETEEKHRHQGRHQGRHHHTRDLVRLSGRRSAEDKTLSRLRYDVTPQSGPPQPVADELFTIDKHGDAMIRQYGANDRYKVPAYRRFGAGRLLGSNSFFTIDRTGTREEFFLRGHGEGGSQLSRDRKSVLARVGRNQSALVRIRSDKSQNFTGTEDFLPLKQPKKRKHEQTESDISADEGPSYRSIHGMSKKHENSESDEAYGSDVSGGFDLMATNDPIKQKTIELTARTKEHADDIDAWIKLADHQDTIRDLNTPDGRTANQAEVKSYAEIKLSILEKALKHSNTPGQITDLRLRIMQEGSKIWNPKTVAKRWEELLVDHGNDFEIWKAYMTFRQTDLSTFRYDELKQLYINKLKAIRTNTAEHSSDSRKILLYEQLVIVFSRLMHFIADTGYAELATAAWQAMLELHFYRPVALANASPELALSGLQTFWESEVARIGDNDAKGWGIFESTGGREDPPEPRLLEPNNLPNTRDPYKAWAAMESHRSQDAKVPARTMDDGTEDDPYRVVMYSDIADLLFFIPTTSLSLVQEQLLDAFLVYCRLPPVFGSSIPIKALLRDQLITGCNNGCLLETVNTTLQNPESGEITPPQFDRQFQSIAKSLDVMFPTRQWFRYIRPIPSTTSSGQYTVVSNVLKQLTSTFRKKDLAIYYLCFESTNNPIGAKKVAKTLLQRDPSNVDLYVALAKSEMIKGNQNTAMSVVPAALGLKDLMLHDRVRLCITWTWMELENNQLILATKRLCHALKENVVEDSISPSEVLKVRQLLTGKRDHHLSARDPNIAVIYAEALALLEYTTAKSSKEPQSGNQGDIWSAMASVTLCSENLMSRGFTQDLAHERFLQFAAQLLYYHASHGPYRPAFFRETIANYIRLFPKNTIFLSLYAWREERLGIEDRVRAILDKTVFENGNDCVSSRVFAIQHEMTIGNPHSTRAAFERAIESGAGKHHIGLWISYIRYCCKKKELRPKSKDVFYRALQGCPWSKEVFMEAFITLLRDMDSSELRSVYHTLCDKGLRVHVELDEFVEQWKKAQRR